MCANLSENDSRFSKWIWTCSKDLQDWQKSWKLRYVSLFFFSFTQQNFQHILVYLPYLALKRLVGQVRQLARHWPGPGGRIKMRISTSLGSGVCRGALESHPGKKRLLTTELLRSGSIHKTTSLFQDCANWTEKIERWINMGKTTVVFLWPIFCTTMHLDTQKRISSEAMLSSKIPTSGVSIDAFRATNIGSHPFLLDKKGPTRLMYHSHKCNVSQSQTSSFWGLNLQHPFVWDVGKNPSQETIRADLELSLPSKIQIAVVRCSVQRKAKGAWIQHHCPPFLGCNVSFQQLHPVRSGLAPPFLLSRKKSHIFGNLTFPSLHWLDQVRPSIPSRLPLGVLIAIGNMLKGQDNLHTACIITSFFEVKIGASRAGDMSHPSQTFPTGRQHFHLLHFHLPFPCLPTQKIGAFLIGICR